MFRRSFFTALCLIGLTLAGKAGNADFLDRKIRVIGLRGQPMLEAVTQLRRAGVPVCFEEVEIDHITDRTVDPRSGDVRIRKTTFSISMKDANVREILNALVRSDSEYVWQADSRDQLIEILPGKIASSGVVLKSVLDWQVSFEQGLTGKRLDIIKDIEDQIGMKQHNVYLMWRGPWDFYNPVVTLQAQSGSARSVLNQLVSFEPKLCWTLAGFKGGRILSCVPCGTTWGAPPPTDRGSHPPE